MHKLKIPQLFCGCCWNSLGILVMRAGHHLVSLGIQKTSDQHHYHNNPYDNPTFFFFFFLREFYLCSVGCSVMLPNKFLKVASICSWICACKYIHICREYQELKYFFHRSHPLQRRGERKKAAI